MARRALFALSGLLVLYLFIAYFIAPTAWKVGTRHQIHPGLDMAPTITRTGAGIPGDPINIAIIATEDDLASALEDAGWYPPVPTTVKSSLRIAGSSLLRRPYVDAPVSNLYVWGRKQDLAFEKPVGHDPRRRHHVRFWQSESLDAEGRPIWVGAATFDTRAGVSHTTGQFTHHIAPDVDKERAVLLLDIERTGWLRQFTWIDNFQPAKHGRNGGGDAYYTDGRLALAVIARFTF
jgi:hypothetical protein